VQAPVPGMRSVAGTVEDGLELVVPDRGIGQGALVTGGSRGIGRAIVKRLAADGAGVVFSFIADEAAAQRVVAQPADRGHEGGWILVR
jgi:short chain dehydrogenase